jgi:hypothetical protein
VDKNNYIIALVLVFIAGLVLLAAWLQWAIFDFILLAVGIIGGLFISYIMYHSFNIQHEVFLTEGEEIVLDSSGSKSYVMLRRVGEDTPQTVVSVDLYLTNLGILAEDRVRHELVIYIPLDRIVKADIEGKGFKIDFFDEYSGQLSQVLLNVGRGFDQWASALYDYLSSRQPPV